MTGDNLGDQIKAYESLESDRRFIPLLPVYARIDGRGFSGFTRTMEKPFDEVMIDLMVTTTEILVDKTHARIGYTQSDEISLVWLADEYKSSIFFDYKIAKITSVLAGLATAAFNYQLRNSKYDILSELLPHFDCRVFQLPNKTETANVFLWREQDATKNAINGAASSLYSHNELQGKNTSEMQEMMFAKGVNFNNYPAKFKRGIFIRKENMKRQLTELELSHIPLANRPTVDQDITRSIMVKLDMPRFGSVSNREAVIFDKAEPIVNIELSK